MLKVVLLATCALMAASPAMAVDFTGPRAEARIGVDRTTLDLSYDDGETSVDGKDHDDGFGLGVEIGYDAPIGSTAVIGGYAGIEGATTKECSEVYGDDEACLKLGRNFTAGVRIGAVVTPKLLMYLKGGYSNGQLRTTYEDFEDADFDTSDKANRDGLHAGVGAEVNVSKSGFVKAEFIHTKYKAYEYSDEFVDAKLDASRTQILAGFGLRF